MIKQITVDNDNIVTACSMGGLIDGGIDVKDIPNDVLYNCNLYRYIDGKFILRDDYTAPAPVPQFTIDDLALAIADLANVIGGLM